MPFSYDSDDDPTYCEDLTQDNYWRWVHQIKERLEYYKLAELIDPEISPPPVTDEAARYAWNTRDKRACGYIKLTLSSNVRDALPHGFRHRLTIDTTGEEVEASLRARELLDHLKERYSVLDSWRKYELYRELWKTPLEEDNPLKGIEIMSGAFGILRSFDKSLDRSQLAAAIAIALPYSYAFIEYDSHGPPEWPLSKLISTVRNEQMRREYQAKREAEAMKANKAQQAQQAIPKRKSRKPVVKDGSKPYCQIHKVNSHSTQDCRSRT
jgi:hypothetical protein